MSAGLERQVAAQMKAEADKMRLQIQLAGQIFAAQLATLPHDVAHNVVVLRDRAKFSKEVAMFLLEQFGMAKVEVPEPDGERPQGPQG